MNRLIRAIEALTTNVGLLGALLIVPLILATCYEVLSRYVFDAPTIWAFEVGYMLTGSHFLLAMAFALKVGQHIRIDIFSGKFSARTRATIDFVCYAIVFPLTVWLTLALLRHMWNGYVSNEKSGQSALNFPVWPFRVVFVVSFLLLALQVLAEILKSLRVLRHGGRPAGAGAGTGGH